MRANGTLPLNTNQHFRGLDSLRFLCALWVAISHISLPEWGGTFLESLPLNAYLEAIFKNVFNGQAAVIVFFVISGFCIHSPNAETKQPIKLKEFYTRRGVRILVPLGLAVLLCYCIGLPVRAYEGAVLWSIWCEIVYYALYPALISLRRRLTSWIPLVAVAYILGLLVAASDLSVGNYHGHGRSLTWLLGLPCWLLGCVAAEIAQRRSRKHISTSTIWTLRMTIATGATLCSVLRFHGSVGYPWSLNLFALLVALWVVAEVWYFLDKSPSAPLEWLGKSSYSFYLTHMLVLQVFALLSLGTSTWLGAGIILFSMIFASIIFWIVVERPSHLFARLMSGKRQAPRSALFEEPAPEISEEGPEHATLRRAAVQFSAD